MFKPSYAAENGNHQRCESYSGKGSSGWADIVRECNRRIARPNIENAQSGILGALGNSIVPQIAYEIFKAIEAAEQMK